MISKLLIPLVLVASGAATGVLAWSLLAGIPLLRLPWNWNNYRAAFAILALAANATAVAFLW